MFYFLKQFLFCENFFVIHDLYKTIKTDTSWLLTRQVKLQVHTVPPAQVGDASHLSRRIRNRNAVVGGPGPTGSLAVAAKRAQSVESVLDRIPQVSKNCSQTQLQLTAWDRQNVFVYTRIRYNLVEL